MKALILNGEKNIVCSLERFSRIIQEMLAEERYNATTVKLHEKNIADCMGCFQCWAKKPGVCIIDDDAREIAELLINSDLVIYLTPVTFGGYSYQLKKAMDRMIPLISPFFTSINGEIHHKQRYEEYPSILGIGVMSEIKQDEVDIFNKLLVRNSINFHSPACASTVLMVSEDLEAIQNRINNLLYKVGETNE